MISKMIEPATWRTIIEELDDRVSAMSKKIFPRKRKTPVMKTDRSLTVMKLMGDAR